MGTNYNPRIITNGLIYCVDPTNPKSYVGNTDTLYDMSKEKNNSAYTIDNDLIVYDATTKSFSRTLLNGTADYHRSANTVDLDQSFTMNVMAIVFQLHANTANGVLTNHSHIHNTGSGITIKYISDTDFRISCNSGDGSTRTYHSYFGTSNIKDTWNYLTVRFIKSTNNLSLWVNGVKEFENSYTMESQADYIDLFNWSTTNATSGSYRPRCKINHASVYNIDLSDDEIKQNFEALRGRFGI